MTTKLEKAKLYGRALRGVHYPKKPLTGWGSYGDTTKATLYIGGKAGLRDGPVPEGAELSKKVVTGALVGLRAEQIGPHAGMTTTVAAGRYKGVPENSYKVEFFHDGSEKTPAAFAKNIKALAQGAAHSLAQREIIVELTRDGKITKTFTASPTKAPSPLDKMFCTWVREHSTSAERNPSDACYQAPKRSNRKARR